MKQLKSLMVEIICTALYTGTLDSLGSVWKSINKAGFRMEDVKFAKVVEKRKHKTYNMAMAAKKWLEQNDSSVRSFNVFTGGSHGRKSWTIFRRVFEKTIL